MSVPDEQLRVNYHSRHFFHRSNCTIRPCVVHKDVNVAIYLNRALSSFLNMFVGVGQVQHEWMRATVF